MRSTPLNTNKFSRIFTIAAGVTALVIILRFCLLVKETAVNLPIWDDFDSALLFVNKYLAAADGLEKIDLVLQQHNEHRIVINKVLTLVSLFLFSTVNFTFLIYCAVTALIGICLLLPYRTKAPLYSFLLGSAFLLQPQYGDGLNWVTTCVASFCLCLIALISSHLAFAKDRLFYLSFLVMALGCFSQGNGILLPVCLAFTLGIHRQWLRAGLVTLSGAIIIALYFYRFNFPTQGKKLSELFANLPALFEYGFTLIGASLGFSDPSYSVIYGVLITLIFIAFIFSKAGKDNPALISFILFLFLSAAINTAARGLSGTQYALSPGRYTILSSGILSALAILCFELFKHYWLKALLVCSALCFNFLSWQKYRSVVEEHEIRALNDFVLHLITDKGLTYPWPDWGVPIFKKALENKIFSVEGVIEELHLAKRASLSDKKFTPLKKDLRTHIDRAQIGKDYIVIEGWALIKNCPSSETSILLKLTSPSSTLVIDPRKKQRGDLLTSFKNPDRVKAGYITAFPKSYLEKSETYSLDILISCRDKNALQHTSYLINTDTITRIQKSQD